MYCIVKTLAVLSLIQLGEFKSEPVRRGKLALPPELDYCNFTLTRDMIVDKSIIIESPKGSFSGFRPNFCYIKIDDYDVKVREQSVVTVEVLSLNTGSFNKRQSSCNGGFLRIKEKYDRLYDNSILPPTELCGSIGNNETGIVKRQIRLNGLIEFQVDHGRSHTHYKLKISFVDKTQPDEQYPVGSLLRSSWSLKDFKCNWFVEFDGTKTQQLFLTSPGWPGIYPPNTTCHYTLEAINKDSTSSRLEFNFSPHALPGERLKLDIHKSRNCEEDYLEIYDGPTSNSPRIGRFCGHDGEKIISSGSILFLIFRSGPGSSPWHYQGFKGKVMSRFGISSERGVRESGTCNWKFKPNYEEDLDKFSDSEHDDFYFGVHIPDYYIAKDTKCKYEFEVPLHYNVSIQVKRVPGRRNCVDRILYYDQSPKPFKNISACPPLQMRKHGRKNFKLFQPKPWIPKSRNPYLTYEHPSGHISNSNPVWIKYKFLLNKHQYARSTTTTTKRPPTKYKGNKTKGGKVLKNTRKSRNNKSQAVINLPHSVFSILLSSLAFFILFNNHFSLSFYT